MEYRRSTQSVRCIDILSMFVLSKWQCVALPTRWRASVRALFYSFHWIRQQISVGKCAHRGAWARQERKTMFQIVTWTKQTWIIHQCTVCPYTGSMITWVLKCSRGHLSIYALLLGDTCRQFLYVNKRYSQMGGPPWGFLCKFFKIWTCRGLQEWV